METAQYIQTQNAINEAVNLKSSAAIANAQSTTNANIGSSASFDFFRSVFDAQVDLAFKLAQSERVQSADFTHPDIVEPRRENAVHYPDEYGEILSDKALFKRILIDTNSDVSLETCKQHYEHAAQLNAAINNNRPLTFRLAQSAYPIPLSQFNDAKRIDDDVIENCPFHVSEKIKQDRRDMLSQTVLLSDDQSVDADDYLTRDNYDIHLSSLSALIQQSQSFL
ncbi:hypothetical protein PN836_004015 [Ningiella sp. W23]|uniref:hypothetical protein n=1 Tax=Ningiella sp. W23 TaxID=3023715 RepID=UPI003756E8B9